MRRLGNKQKHFTIRILPVVLSIFFLCCCSLTNQEILYAMDEDSAATDSSLEGSWVIGAVDFDENENPALNAIVDIADSEELLDLYDGYSLTLNTDGTFVYKMNVFFEEGSYTLHPSNPDCYILKADRSYRLELENGEEKEIENDTKVNYILEVCDDSLHLQEYDSFTGKAKANDNGYYFVKDGEDSKFIQENKEEIGNDKPVGDYDSVAGILEYASDSSYSGILKSYTTKMENAVDGLIDEYYRDSYGISDIDQLAEICNEKVGKLAEICNEGMGKMADLMYKNNDSYETYSGWVTKLMDNYNEIAQRIMDAYIDSTM